MPDGTNVVGLNYPTEAELENLDIYAWDRSNPNSQFKVQMGSAGVGGSGGSTVEQWAPNFTADGDVYIPADDAMAIAQGNAKIGTGTIAFAKSTAAAPDTFDAVTLPVTLEAGAWLKVSATGVTGFVATHLVRS